MPQSHKNDGKRRRNKNRVINADADGQIVVTSTARRVRLTVAMVPRKTNGAGEDASTVVTGPPVIASAHLDEDAVDRLIKRLQNTRGGKAHMNKPPSKALKDLLALPVDPDLGRKVREELTRRRADEKHPDDEDREPIGGDYPADIHAAELARRHAVSPNWADGAMSVLPLDMAEPGLLLAALLFGVDQQMRPGLKLAAMEYASAVLLAHARKILDAGLAADTFRLVIEDVLAVVRERPGSLP